ncbi:regulatory protein RecX [uncultured Anaerococcus sp.]|uniref:regulatory protein RecX n=1 Tax=uncultured Anaerococcus sp. TaxID=293428 RepID=UPI00288AFA41|nr:regulatory protein RecX [uncultured Anaerococcus sp.]
MIVEEIDYSDKYNLCRLNISGEFFYVSYDFFNDLGISRNDEVDFADFKKISEENSYNRAKNYILSRISYANKTSFEIGKILRDKGYEADVVDRVMNFLVDFHLIDDNEFVRAFISDKSSINGWTRNKIKYKLRIKGIPDSLIDENLDLIDAEKEYERAKYFAQKKARGDYSFANKNKVYRHLASKGFDFDLISRVVGEIFS